MSFFQRINPGNLPDDINPQNILDVTREKVLQISILMNSAFSTLFLVAGLLIGLNNHSLSIAIISALIFILSGILLLYRDLTNDLRVLGLLVSFYVIGVLLLLNVWCNMASISHFFWHWSYAQSLFPVLEQASMYQQSVYLPTSSWEFLSPIFLNPRWS